MVRNEFILGLLGLAVLAMGGGVWLDSAPPDADPNLANAATPAGITFQPLGAAQGYASNGSRYTHPPRSDIAYSNEKGLTLYTYDGDQPGRSNCTGDCAKSWIPARPVRGARPVPGWTIIRRPDWSRQWALHGKPLYTYVKDQEGGDVGGRPSDPNDGNDNRSKMLAALKGKPLYKASADTLDKAAISGDFDIPHTNALVIAAPDGWHPAMFKSGGAPAVGVTPPHGIKLEEVTDANGVILANERDMTLYAFSGDVNEDKALCDGVACNNQFIPLAAPGLAHANGDWSIVGRKDGIEQWAYKGQPLYTYQGDQIVGDVNGGDLDPRWRVAVIASEYLPSNVRIAHNPGRGVMLTTPDGMTLYRREAKAWLAGDVYVAGSAFQLHDFPYRPKVGRSIRPNECKADCLKTWKPYAAPADAQPGGNWGIFVRADGIRQWTYKDYALYTYAGDKKPGDMIGDDIYDVALTDKPNEVNDIGYPQADVAALYWMHVPL